MRNQAFRLLFFSAFLLSLAGGGAFFHFTIAPLPFFSLALASILGSWASLIGIYLAPKIILSRYSARRWPLQDPHGCLNKVRRASFLLKIRPPQVYWTHHHLNNSLMLEGGGEQYLLFDEELVRQLSPPELSAMIVHQLIRIKYSRLKLPSLLFFLLGPPLTSTKVNEDGRSLIHEMVHFPSLFLMLFPFQFVSKNKAKNEWLRLFPDEKEVFDQAWRKVRALNSGQYHGPLLRPLLLYCRPFGWVFDRPHNRNIDREMLA